MSAIKQVSLALISFIIISSCRVSKNIKCLNQKVLIIKGGIVCRYSDSIIIKIQEVSMDTLLPKKH